MADNTYGISQADWDKVTGCAEAIRRLGVQVINGDLNKSEWTFERSVAAERARSLLAELMDKYGRIPPLLSLLASYAKDEAEREQVLRERWELASHNADRAEMLRSAMELATHFALGGDLFQARRWIGDLKKLSADAAELRWIEELVWQQIKG